MYKVVDYASRYVINTYLSEDVFLAELTQAAHEYCMLASLCLAAA